MTVSKNRYTLYFKPGDKFLFFLFFFFFDCLHAELGFDNTNYIIMSCCYSRSYIYTFCRLDIQASRTQTKSKEAYITPPSLMSMLHLTLPRAVLGNMDDKLEHRSRAISVFYCTVHTIRTETSGTIQATLSTSEGVVPASGIQLSIYFRFQFRFRFRLWGFND